MANILGHSLTISSFGESHGKLIGVVLDGFPSNQTIDLNYIQRQLDRRKPGQSKYTSSRNEDEEFEIVSGVFENKSTGAPICILIPNTGQNSKDYDELKDVYRPGHADFVYSEKYGHRDYRGGGRSSARITAGWVAAGAIVKQYLEINHNINIQSVVSRVGDIGLENIYSLNWDSAEDNPIRCPDLAIAAKMSELISDTGTEGDSIGGSIATRVRNCPVGLGEPVFDKLNADIAKAVFSLNAVKGLEFGSGFAGTYTKGSTNNDGPDTDKNNDGGITAGISNGKQILFTTAFKPVSSISKEQTALNSNGDQIKIQIKGRHDPCVLPRAVPILESLTALILADHLLLNTKYEK
jgi:chorismate synthase